MKLDHIHHVGIAARDPQASEAFYRDVLGLEPAGEGPGKTRDLRIGGTLLAISALRPGEGITLPHGEHLAFQAKVPLEAIMEHLARHQVPFEQASSRLYLRDPDGHVIELIAPPHSG